MEVDTSGRWPGVGRTWTRWACRLLAVAATLWTWSSSRRPEPPGPDRAGLVYREGPGPRRLDVYLPAPDGPGSAAPRIGVLAIHGGSWTGGSRRAYGLQVRRLTDRGLVVFAADYRLARPGMPSWPGAADDVREAVRWIRRNAGEFGVDPGRIVALGTSAGGHLAAILGTPAGASELADRAARVQAVVTLSAPFDLPALKATRRLEHDPLDRLAGGDERSLVTASPIFRVSGESAPMLVIHGGNDLWVPPGQADRMAAELARHGVTHRKVIIPGARHGFELLVLEPERRDLADEIAGFLASGAIRAEVPGG